jgi:hypothetical protein
MSAVGDSLIVEAKRIKTAHKRRTTFTGTTEPPYSSLWRARTLRPKYYRGLSGEALRRVVHAAAKNISTLATMTGEALMSTPYVIENSAPNICTLRSSDGRVKKYEPTKTQVAVHPDNSIPI